VTDIKDRPICPFCGVGHLIPFADLMLCAYCRKAWLAFEFEIDLHRREQQKETQERDASVSSGGGMSTEFQ
jgi:hypothetical protein